MLIMSKKENRNYLEFNEIVEYFFKSWIWAFKHLGWLVKRDKGKIFIKLAELVQKNIPTPSITQFELWAEKFENNIHIYVQNDFRECGLDSSRTMDFESFKSWINKDHNLFLSYADKSIVVATNLAFLDDIGFTDTPQQFVSYPSFNR